MRRTSIRLLLPILMMLSVAMSSGNVNVRAQDETDAQVLTFEEEVIAAGVTTTLDDLGRVPLVRLTLEPTAGIGPEDLPPPFLVFVESGTLRFRDGDGSVTEITTGANVTVEADADYSLRSTSLVERSTLLVLLLPGSCYMFAGVTCMPPYLPYDMTCEGPCRPDVTNTFLFLYSDLMNRYLPVDTSVSRLLVPAEQTLESIDVGGETELIRFYVRVESGSVVTSDADRYGAGDEFTLKADGPLVVGETGAVLIIVRVADAAESN